MPSYWLLKTEPDTYSYDDLERDGATVWDGVSNNAALKHLRSMHPGDYAFVYHTGDERQIVGLAEVMSQAYPDPHEQDPKLVVIDIRPLRRVTRAVSLAQIKADPFFADFALVRQGRLSVVPVERELWTRLITMAGEEAL